MWFGFFYPLAYLVWTMIYFGWRGRWIYDFLDWSKPVSFYWPDLLCVLVLVIGAHVIVMFSRETAGLADILRWYSSAVDLVLHLLGSDLSQLSALADSTTVAWRFSFVVRLRRATRKCAKRRGPKQRHSPAARWRAGVTARNV